MTLTIRAAEPGDYDAIRETMMQAALDLADKWLQYTRIELTVFTDNAAAIALDQRIGFEIEGTHRAYAFRGGEFVDAYAMARLNKK